VLIFYDGKNACSFGFNFRDGYWGVQLISIRATIRDFKAGAAPVSYFSLCTLGVFNSYPDTKRWPWPLYVASSQPATLRMEFDLCLSQKIHTKMVRLMGIIQTKYFTIVKRGPQIIDEA